MFEQASNLRRWALAGAVLAWYGCQGTSALAGEKVTFSDSVRKPTLPAESKRNTGRSVSFSNPFEDFGARGSSSLRGVTARPFAPSAPMAQPDATPLTKRELDLLNERRNWILQAPDGGKLGETDANKAFGVDGFEGGKKGGVGSGLDSSQGDLVNYYQRLEATSGTGSAATPPAVVRSSVNGLSSPTLSSDDSGGAPANPFAGPTGFSARNQTRESPFEIRRVSPAEQDRDSLNNALRQITSSASKAVAGPQDAGIGGVQPADLSGMAMILGRNPISSPIAASPISSLDPIAAYPDSTREALNPVLGQAATPKPLPFQPSFATSEKFDKALQLPPSTALQGLGANTFLAPPSVPKSLDSPLVERRSLQSIKAQFDLPKRSF